MEPLLSDSICICSVLIVLKDGLCKNFVNADVQVVDCPDLREKPWMLAASGW